MKLELKHLAAYLPYNLKVVVNSNDKIIIEPMVGIKHGNVYVGGNAIDVSDGWQFKPILRPLSDLAKEITIETETFTPIEWFEIGDDGNASLEYDCGNLKIISELILIAKHDIDKAISFLPFGAVQKLFEWHFDVFGLIHEGLAIDINTLNTK